MTRWQVHAARSGQGNLTPGIRALTINIVCSSMQALRFRLQGEQANGEFSYGKQGRLLVRLKDARLDNQPIQLGSIGSEGLLQTTFASELNVTAGMWVIPEREGRTVAGNTLTLVMQIEPELTANVAQPYLAGSREGHIMLILE